MTCALSTFSVYVISLINIILLLLIIDDNPIQAFRPCQLYTPSRPQLCFYIEETSPLMPNAKTHFQPLKDQRIADKCTSNLKCDFESKYRYIDGSCNNKEYPMWGKAGTALTRLVQAAYQDNKYSPRLMSNGKALPSARVLRTTFFPVRECPSYINAVMLMYWGQLVAHDVTHLIPTVPGHACCGKPEIQIIQENPVGTMLPENKIPSTCLPIPVPKDDPFYSKYNITCLGFERVQTTNNVGCTIYPAQQITGITHFIDSSQVYGSDKKLADSLRTFSGGKLKYQTSEGQIFLPNVAKPTARCNVADDSAICYKSGDDRVIQNLGIAMLATLCMREHNRLAEGLAEVNPQWNDETLYQEAKRLLNAELQHITYSEFISSLLGEEYVIEHGLKVKGGFEETYDPNVDPATINEVATGAYRVFHNMVPLNVLSSTQEGCPLKVLKFADFYNNPGILQGNYFSKFMYGLAYLPSKEADRTYSQSIANLFNKANNTQFGTDLPAIDLQRGRDNGIPPYIQFREACGYGAAKDFSDLASLISRKHIDKLQSVYNQVGDIDLLVGGLLERFLPGSTVGPTFQCLLKEQFFRWRYGDRYFYNLKSQAGSFTKEQLGEIQKVTLARLFCDNVDGTTDIVKNLFHTPSQGNWLVPCSEIPSVDLRAWASE